MERGTAAAQRTASRLKNQQIFVDRYATKNDVKAESDIENDDDQNDLNDYDDGIDDQKFVQLEYGHNKLEFKLELGMNGVEFGPLELTSHQKALVDQLKKVYPQVNTAQFIAWSKSNTHVKNHPLLDLFTILWTILQKGIATSDQINQATISTTNPDDRTMAAYILALDDNQNLLALETDDDNLLSLIQKITIPQMLVGDDDENGLLILQHQHLQNFLLAIPQQQQVDVLGGDDHEFGDDNIRLEVPVEFQNDPNNLNYDPYPMMCLLPYYIHFLETYRDLRHHMFPGLVFCFHSYIGLVTNETNFPINDYQWTTCPLRDARMMIRIIIAPSESHPKYTINSHHSPILVGPVSTSFLNLPPILPHDHPAQIAQTVLDPSGIKEIQGYFVYEYPANQDPQSDLIEREVKDLSVDAPWFYLLSLLEPLVPRCHYVLRVTRPVVECVAKLYFALFGINPLERTPTLPLNGRVPPFSRFVEHMLRTQISKHSLSK